MSDYRITVAFSQDLEEPKRMPNVISAYDEYTEENWGEVPEWYLKEIQENQGPTTRLAEMEIFVPEEVVRELFYRKAVHANVRSIKEML